jgi:NTP pyrophosphatase (non-canonical NTP hydrolase)
VARKKNKACGQYDIMTYTLEALMEKMMSSLPDDYIIQNDDDALIKAAFTTEELGEVVKAIAHGTDREVVYECADAIVGLLQIMTFYNYEGPQGIGAAFDRTLARLKQRKMESQ